MITMEIHETQSESNFRVAPILPIRLATPSDIPAIADLVNAAFKIETFFDGARTDEKNIAEMMQAGKFFLIEDGSGQLIASLYAELHDERGYFGMFAVRPSHQSHGLGRRITKAAEQYCSRRGCKFVDVKMLSPRTVLLPFYHSMGYKETGIEAFPSAYRLKKDGLKCDFILLSKEL